MSRSRFLLIVAFTGTLLPAAAQGDFVFLKDGFTLRGHVQKEGKVIRDMPSGQELWMPRLGGFYIVDDYARRVIFSHRNVSEARDDPGDKNQEIFHINQVKVHPNASSIDVVLRQEVVSPWSNHGWRSLRLKTGEVDGGGSSIMTIDQGIGVLTPFYARASARRQHWTCSLLTSELDPHNVLQMIRTHLADKVKPGEQTAGKPPLTLDQHFRIVRFCIQTGWYDDAEAELKGIRAHFPDAKEKIEETAKELRKLQAGRMIEIIERASRAGQHVRAQVLLGGFAEEHAEVAVLNQLRPLKDRYAKDKTGLETTRQLLQAVRGQTKEQGLRPELAAAMDEIDRGLHVDTYPRLETLVKLARQEELNRAQAKKAEKTAEELVALAVSGWLVGSTAAESQPTAVVKLWQARQLILRYMQLDDAEERQKLLYDYSRGQPLSADVIAQLIALLPPSGADPQTPQGLLELSATPLGGDDKIPYWVQLPPEYHAHRPYPVLMVLHAGGEGPKHMMARWANLAALHGHILVAPQWADMFTKAYDFTDERRSRVIDVLRDVRRRFQADSERVFLAGYSQSGIMAYDIGLLYPDLFAGVMIMSGRPKSHGGHKANGQLLPFYVVAGERGPDEPRAEMRQLFEHWVQRGYPSLYVEYRGRGFEFFSGELPYMFDWMSKQKRAKGVPELGRPDPQGGALGQEFRTHRQGTNRFYWLSTDMANGNKSYPGRLSARIPGNNDVIVQAQGVRNLTVWLNAGIIDFEQPTTIRVNPSGKIFRGTIKPSLEVLLEDFYTRGDKQNLFVAKKEFRW